MAQVIHAQIGGHPVKLRVADTPQAQAQGYRGASSVSPTDGIYFQDMPAGAVFTMQGVYTALAIAFLDPENRVLQARLMQPGEQWIPSAPGTRHAIEVHPDLLPSLQSGQVTMGERQARLGCR